MDRTSTTEIEDALRGLVVEKAECQVCGDSGYVWDEVEHRVTGRCECSETKKAQRLNEWKRAETYRLKSILLPKIDLTRTVKDGGKKWLQTLPEIGGVWISGPAGEGKTHAVGWMLARRIAEAKRPFLWSWFSARRVMDAWSGQYSDDYDKRDIARNVMNALALHDVIVINDIDKIGKITEAREEHFFDLFDGMYSRNADLLIPSNITLDAFCARMTTESLFIDRDGLGPQQRRLRDLCKEIKL